MKKLWFILFIFLTAPAFSQNIKKDIEKVLTCYSNTLKEKNADSLMGFMYPKYFNVFPKDIMVNGLKKSFADTGLVMNFGKVEVLSVSQPYTENKITYVLVNYTSDISITLSKTVSTLVALDIMKKAYSDAFGEENVKVNTDTRTFDIKANKYMFAIKDPAYGNRWWIVEKSPEIKDQLSTVLPAKVWEIK